MEMIPATESTLRDLALMKGLRKLQYEKMIEGMNATKPGEPLRVDGVVTETEVPDYNVQHKFWSDSLRVTGDIKPDVGTDKSIRITVNRATKEDVKKLIELSKDLEGQYALLKAEGHQTGEIN